MAKQKDQKKAKQAKEGNQKQTSYDTLGSYTGKTADGRRPTQDVDDLRS